MKGLKIFFDTTKLAESYATGLKYAHRRAKIDVKGNAVTLAYPDDTPEEILELLEGIFGPANERRLKVERLR